MPLASDPAPGFLKPSLVFENVCPSGDNARWHAGAKPPAPDMQSGTPIELNADKAPLSVSRKWNAKMAKCPSHKEWLFKGYENSLSGKNIVTTVAFPPQEEYVLGF